MGEVERYGIHPFPSFSHDGTLYVADALRPGDVRKYEKSLWLCETSMNFIEFVSFCMHDSGEDLGIIHRRYDEALEKLKLALEIDPNNYLVLPTIGNTYFNMWLDSGRPEFFEAAEKHYKMLVRKMPGIADSYMAYGEFCLGAYESPEWALRLYRKALKKPTMDAQVLWVLKKRFGQLGEQELQHTAEGYFSWLTEHLGIRDYFSADTESP